MRASGWSRQRSRVIPDAMQLNLPFGPIVNREFLSNHWLDHRLPLEPEWSELRNAATAAAEKLIALWDKEKNRVERYGDEAGLEEKFIQPVFEILSDGVSSIRLFCRVESQTTRYLLPRINSATPLWRGGTIPISGFMQL
jgi:hypothetical protein